MRRQIQSAAAALALLAASAHGGPSPRLGVLVLGDDSETNEAHVAFVETLRLAGLSGATIERTATVGETESRAALLDLQHEDVETVVAIGDAASRLAHAVVRDRFLVCAAFDEGQAAELAAGGNACVVTGAPPAAVLTELRRAAPGLRRVGVFVPAGDEAARLAAQRLGREVEVVLVDGEGPTSRARAASAAPKLVGDVDVAWIPPSVSAADAGELAIALAGRGLALVGACKAHLDAGCAVVVRADPHSLGALAAVLAQQVAGGAGPGKIPLRRAKRLRVDVNLPAARRLGFTLPPALLAWADFIRPGTTPR